MPYVPPNVKAMGKTIPKAKMSGLYSKSKIEDTTYAMAIAPSQTKSIGWRNFHRSLLLSNHLTPAFLAHIDAAYPYQLFS